MMNDERNIASTSLDSLFRQQPALGQYVRFLAKVVNSLGKPEFEEHFIEFLSKLVPIDHCAVFTYSDNGEAGHLFTHSRMPGRQAEKLARDYVEKFHDQDPNFSLIQDLKDKDYHQLQTQNLNADYDPAYHNHFLTEQV